MDLKDKIKFTDSDGTIHKAGEIVVPVLGHEAVAALVMFGFTQANAQKVVSNVIKDIPAATIEVIIKEALKRL